MQTGERGLAGKSGSDKNTISYPSRNERGWPSYKETFLSDTYYDLRSHSNTALLNLIPPLNSNAKGSRIVPGDNLMSLLYFHHSLVPTNMSKFIIMIAYL